MAAIASSACSTTTDVIAVSSVSDSQNRAHALAASVSPCTESIDHAQSVPACEVEGLKQEINRDNFEETFQVPPQPLLYRALSKLQSSESRWPNPEGSVGEYYGIHEDRIQKYKCWGVKGKAEETFMILGPKIKTILNSNNDLKPSLEVIQWSPFMIGKSTEKAVPYVMFMCSKAAPRKKAADVVKKSGILKAYPGFRAGHWPHPPHTGDLSALGSGWKVSLKPVSRISERTARISLNSPAALQLCIESTSLEVRTSTVGAMIPHEGQIFFFGVSHIFAKSYESEFSNTFASENGDIDEIDEDDDEEFMFEGFSDDDDDDSSDFEDNGSATSVSDQTYIGSVDIQHSNISSLSRSPESLSLHSSESRISTTRNGLDVDFRLESSQFATSGSYRSQDTGTNSTLATMCLSSTDLDYSLIFPTSTINLPALQHLPIISSATVTKIPRGETRITTCTGTSGNLRGSLSGALAYIRVGKSRDFQDCFMVKVDGPLSPGDSGSIIMNSETGTIYGHVVAGSVMSRTAYILPAVNVLKNLVDRCIQNGGNELELHATSASRVKYHTGIRHNISAVEMTRLEPLLGVLGPRYDITELPSSISSAPRMKRSHVFEGASSTPSIRVNTPPLDFSAAFIDQTKTKHEQRDLLAQIPRIGKFIAEEALRKAAHGLVPYGEDEAKRCRYQKYLESQAGITAKVPQDSPTEAEEAWLKELREFADFTKAFKQTSDMMSSYLQNRPATSQARRALEVMTSIPLQPSIDRAQNGLAGVWGKQNAAQNPSYQRPKHDRAYCELCDDSSAGCRSEHEQLQHFSLVHNPNAAMKWMCIDPIDHGNHPVPLVPLSRCKACTRQCKRYSTYHSAVAHLRQAHFNPKVKGRDKSDIDERGWKAVYRGPSVTEMKTYWMKEVDEETDSFDDDQHATDESDKGSLEDPVDSTPSSLQFSHLTGVTDDYPKINSYPTASNIVDIYGVHKLPNLPSDYPSCLKEHRSVNETIYSQSSQGSFSHFSSDTLSSYTSDSRSERHSAPAKKRSKSIRLLRQLVGWQHSSSGEEWSGDGEM